MIRLFIICMLVGGGGLRGCHLPAGLQARYLLHRQDNAQRGALAHYARALLAERQGEPAAAAREYEQAIARDPLSPGLRVRLAALYLRAEQPEKARETLQQALAIDPGNVSTRTMLALVFTSRGEL